MKFLMALILMASTMSFAEEQVEDFFTYAPNTPTFCKNTYKELVTEKEAKECPKFITIKELSIPYACQAGKDKDLSTMKLMACYIVIDGIVREKQRILPEYCRMGATPEPTSAQMKSCAFLSQEIFGKAKTFRKKIFCDRTYPHPLTQVQKESCQLDEHELVINSTKREIGSKKNDEDPELLKRKSSGR